MDTYNEVFVKKERYSAYERNQWISERHRHFGRDVPAADLDFLMMEYDSGEPIALIEYKGSFEKYSLNHPTIRAQAKLATRAGLPAFVVVYYQDYYNYYVVPINDIAKTVPWCDEPRFFNEVNFVKMLYWLRKRKAPKNVLDKLHTQKIPDGIKPNLGE
jgi:hypothetical protein